MAILNRPTTFVGLGTFNHTAMATRPYNIQADISVNPASSVVAIVTLNGATKYTAPALVPTSKSIKFKFQLNCTANDVIAVVLSSAATIDNQLNTVKSTITFGDGY